MNLNDKFVDYKALNENTKLILGEALTYNKGLAGGYSGDFPLSVAAKDNIYRVPATNKFYVCTENYSGTQLTAPNDKFVELSVWKNHDRLSNLVNKNNGYFTIDNLKICFGTVAIKEINKAEEFFLPVTYEKNFNILVTESLISSKIAAFTYSLNSFKVIATGKSEGISYITIGY